jgi:hypothetical protein
MAEEVAPTLHGGVIHDGSPVYSGNGLRPISQMTFTTLPASSPSMPFNIKWEIQTKDGQTLSLMLHPNWKLVGSFLIRTHSPK